MNQNRKIYRVTLSTDDVDAFLRDCEGSEWYAMDTGERIMTDAGPDAEAVLLVEPVAKATATAPQPILH